MAASPSRAGGGYLREATLSARAEPNVVDRGHEAIDDHVAIPCGSGGESARLAPGTLVGRYVVESLIGRGAMGTVYAANDPDLARKVAVKLLRAEALSDGARQRMRTRLLREAQAMARLSHPEVIAVYDVGAFRDQLFVAMEYVEGDTLRHWRSAGHRSYQEILTVYERAGSGLAAAHEAGLVHRDFKPDNVLVAHDGRVRVTDFGLARSAAQPDGTLQAPSAVECCSSDESLAMTLTITGSLLGTPAYMAPEQLRGAVADARSDVFSFCVALYEALYGERPFAGSTMLQLRSAIDEGAVRAPPLMTPVPGWVRGVLLRGVRAAPEARFNSMRELIDALRAARAAARRRTGRALRVAVAVTTAAAAVVAYWTSRPGADRQAFAPPLHCEPAAAIGETQPRDTILPTQLRAEIAAGALSSVARESPKLAPAPMRVRAGRPAPHPPFRAGEGQSPAAPRGTPAVGKNGAFILD